MTHLVIGCAAHSFYRPTGFRIPAAVADVVWYTPESEKDERVFWAKVFLSWWAVCVGSSGKLALSLEIPEHLQSFVLTGFFLCANWGADSCLWCYRKSISAPFPSLWAVVSRRRLPVLGRGRSLVLLSPKGHFWASSLRLYGRGVCWWLNSACQPYYWMGFKVVSVLLVSRSAQSCSSQSSHWPVALSGS